MQHEEYQRRAMEQIEAVYRLAYHLTRRADEAEDLVQETYLRALKPSAAQRFEDPTPDQTGMRAWLFSICHNAFYTHLRKQKRTPSTSAEFYEPSHTEPAPDAAPPAWSLRELDWQQVDGSLKRAIEALRPEFREVLLLWGVEGLKYREIATILEVPIGTVMSRLHRARALLAEALQADPAACEALGLRLSEVPPPPKEGSRE